MTYSLFFATPYALDDPLEYFSEKITFEKITSTILGKAILGDRAHGETFMLTVDGKTEILLDKGYHRDHCSYFFKEGVIRLRDTLPSITFFTTWMNSKLWEQHSHSFSKAVWTLTDFENSFPTAVVENIRYVVELDGRYR